MPPVVKRFVVTGQFVERVNAAMMRGDEYHLYQPSSAAARVKEIVSNTKLTEEEMRKNFSAAISAFDCPA